MCLLKEVEVNVGSQKNIAKKFGISTSKLLTILKNRKYIEECLQDVVKKQLQKENL